MKYIMFETTLNTLVKRVPIIFPNEFVHEDIANKIKEIYPTWTIKSAGFCYVYVDNTHSESKTLKVKAMKEDANIISSYDYQHGIV